MKNFFFDQYGITGRFIALLIVGGAAVFVYVISMLALASARTSEEMRVNCITACLSDSTKSKFDCEWRLCGRGHQ